VNYSNLQKLFFGLIFILKYTTSSIPIPKTTETITEKILNIPEGDRLKIFKKILEIFSSIGYHNLWAESFNSLSNLSYYKELK
jgi:hypothetical protein